MTILWDWSWQLYNCELYRLRYIDKIVTSLCRKRKCALLFLHKDWLTKHTSYARFHKGLSVFADQSGLTDQVFTTILSYLQSSLNNSQNLSTDYTSNELFYKFHINNTFDAISSADVSLKNYTQLCQIYCKDAE